MVLFDLVGDCNLGIPREENSDPDLYRLFSDAAQELRGDILAVRGHRRANPR